MFTRARNIDRGIKPVESGNSRIWSVMLKFGVYSLVWIIVSLGMACGDSSRLADLREKRAATRAYDGAPPVIPHKLKEIGRHKCIHCHKKGDARLGSGVSTVTPHPDFVNCRQCHVNQIEDDAFKENSFVAYRIKKSPKKSQLLGPPYIPHRLQNRENCMACHLSNTASNEIVPGHGADRTNCTQCHVLQTEPGTFYTNLE